MIQIPALDLRDVCLAERSIRVDIFTTFDERGMMRTIGVVCVIAISIAGIGAIFRECVSDRSSNMRMKEQDNTNKTEIKPTQATEFKELTSVKGTTKDGAPYSAQI